MKDGDRSMSWLVVHLQVSDSLMGSSKIFVGLALVC